MPGGTLVTKSGSRALPSHANCLSDPVRRESFSKGLSRAPTQTAREDISCTQHQRVRPWHRKQTHAIRSLVRQHTWPV